MICIPEEDYEELISEINLYKSIYYKLKDSINIDIGGSLTSKSKKGYNFISIKQSFIEELFNINLENEQTTVKIYK